MADGTDAGENAGLAEAGGGAAAEVRGLGGSAAAAGSPVTWPPVSSPSSLRTAAGLVQACRFPSVLAWGPEFICLHNDACRPLLGDRPEAIGRPFFEVWPELLEPLGALFHEAVAGESVQVEASPLTVLRHGEAEQAWFTLSISPVRDETGAVAGLFVVAVEVTEPRLAERRQTFRLALDRRLRDVADPDEVAAIASQALARHLGAGQAVYGEVDASGAFVAIAGGWNDGTSRPVEGRHRLDDSGPAVAADLRGGRTVAIGDVRLDPRMSAPEAPAGFERVSPAAFINAPLVRDGRLVAILAVHHASPRAWSAEEVALAEEVAERAWAAAGRARAERALQAERERLRRMFEQAPGFICILQGPDHVFDFVNDAHRRLFLRRNIVGKTVREAFPDLAGQGYYETLDAVYRTGRRHVAKAAPARLRLAPDAPEEERVLDFVYEPLTDAAGRVTGIFCEGFDVTEAHRANEALRRSEEFNRRVLSSSDDCIKMLGLDGRLETMSEGGQRALGIADLAPFVGTMWADAFEPEGRPVARGAVAEARNGRTARFEAKLRTQQGAMRDWDTVLTPVLGDEGRPQTILALSRDVTEQREAETARRESEARRAFLLSLGDLVRPMADPAAVIAATTRALGAQLGATRVAYAEIDEAADRATARGDWTDGAAVHLPEEIRLGDFGARLVARLRAGGTLRVDDVRYDAHTSESLDALEGIGARALVSVPLFKDSRFVVNLNVHQDRPRAWTDAEVELIEAVAERTWEAVERVRVETALRVSEGELQTLTDTLPVLIAYVDAERRYRFINRIYEDWFPRRRKDILGRPVVEVIGEAAYAAVAPYMDRVLAGERLTFEQLMPYADTAPRHVEVEYVPRLGPGGHVEGFYGLVQDVSARKAAEGALRESEARFRTMADNAPVMMWVTDPSGSCTYLNARWYEFSGQAPGAGEGYGWLDAVHPDDRPGAQAAFVSANAERRDYRVDFRLRRADGVYRWAIDAAAARTTATGEYLGYVGSVIDIDERREAEARLALGEEQLRLATEAAEVGLWDVDVATGTLFWPPRVKAMFGISPDVPVSMADFYAGLHPDDAGHTGVAFAAACDPAVRALYDVEYRTVGKDDGLVRWVAAKGRGVFDDRDVCVRVIGTAIDITTRKAGEARLHELNETLEQRVAERTAERNRVWEMSRDMLAIMGFDGHLKAINPAWEATLGMDAATLLSRPFPEQVHPDDHGAVEAVMERLLGGETVERFEDRLRHADGTWRWMSWTLVPEGDVFYAVGRDITAERAAAAELEQAQEALRQSQKMEAMGQLTGGVAHDFNNLLTPIVGALDMLQRKGLGGEREQRLIAGAIQSADRAKTLVQRLLAFARRQPLQASAVDVGKLVTGMADLVASTSGPQIKVVVEAADGLPPAKADPNQLEMALLNLGVNARDAMPDGGTLRIAAAPERVREGHRSKLKQGDYIRLSVADTGIGMDEATLARAVEPFFSTKGVGKGTGLGLSMVHGLASQLGGALTIDSRPGVGTHVELWLPQTGETPEAAEAAPETAAARTSMGKALLVDDEELVRISTADMLADMGFAVVEASSAEEAVRLLDAGLRPDLLVTDHLMPGMTGTDLARFVRRTRPELPVLIVSGYAESEGIAPDLPRLTKPFRNADLAASLSALRGAGGR